MCTAMTIQTLRGNSYFGRTMDFSYPLDPEIYSIPQGYQWSNLLNTHKIHNRYGFIGIGQDLSPIIFADGINEMGFAAAALYFPDDAKYDSIADPHSPQLSIAAIELVNFLLGQCASVEQAVSILPTIRIVGLEDPVTNSVAPLHWIMADESGNCMAIEKTADGLQIMDNPIGVLSNSPDFSWHVTNLRNYMTLSPFQQQETEWSSVKLTPFGQGAGAFGLPGDDTPPSRFVRTAYRKSHTPLPAGRNEAVVTCFHILESVSIPKGLVITNRKTADYTQYTAIIDISAKNYYFKTYDNSQIVSVKLPDGHNDRKEVISLGKLTRPIEFDCWKS